MKENYTIDEILLAVEDLQIKKRAKSEKNFKKKIDSLNFLLDSTVNFNLYS